MSGRALGHHHVVGDALANAARRHDGVGSAGRRRSLDRLRSGRRRLRRGFRFRAGAGTERPKRRRSDTSGTAGAAGASGREPAPGPVRRRRPDRGFQGDLGWSWRLALRRVARGAAGRHEGLDVLPGDPSPFAGSAHSAQIDILLGGEPAHHGRQDASAWGRGARTEVTGCDDGRCRFLRCCGGRRGHDLGRCSLVGREDDIGRSGVGLPDGNLQHRRSRGAHGGSHGLGDRRLRSIAGILGGRAAGFGRFADHSQGGTHTHRLAFRHQDLLEDASSRRGDFRVDLVG